MNLNGRKRIGLALGGGVLRGLAHVGVLAVLEREGIPIDCVAGTSAGSLVGVLYCAGVEMARLRELAFQVGWTKIASLVWPSQGFVSFAKLERWLIEVIGDRRFSDLLRPFTAVAFDLDDGRTVAIREGRVAPAVRASCSVPGIVVPAEWEGHRLGDGGVADNVPVSAVREMGAEYVIAVDVCQPAYGKRGPFGTGLTTIETLIQRAGGGYRAADCLITPQLAGFSYVRLSQRAELIARGEQAAENNISFIKAALAGETVLSVKPSSSDLSVGGMLDR
jgi:NTE family protein